MKFKNSNQRKAVMAKLRTKLVRNQSIPVLTGSLGNAQPKEKALAFRVWVHPKNGDDYFYEYPNIKLAKIKKMALKEDKNLNEVEPVIGVFKKKIKKYPNQQWWEARLK